MRRAAGEGKLKETGMANKKNSRKTVAIAAAVPQLKPQLPIPALLLRVGLILAAAGIVQQFLPHP